MTYLIYKKCEDFRYREAFWKPFLKSVLEHVRELKPHMQFIPHNSLICSARRNNF